MSPAADLLFGLAIAALIWVAVQARNRRRLRSTGQASTRGIVIPLAVIAVCVALLGIYAHFQAQPKVFTTYADISIGDGRQSVLYAKGQPSRMLGNEAPVSSSVGPSAPPGVNRADLPAGKTILDYSAWSYDLPNGSNLVVRFSSPAQTVASIECFARAQTQCPALLGISGGETEDELVERLGTPQSASLSSGLSVMKTVTFKNTNAHFLLDKRRVYGLIVTGPQ